MRKSWLVSFVSIIKLANATSSLGKWGPVIQLPLVPAAGFIEHDSGKIMTFSSFQPNAYQVKSGITLTAAYDPASGIAILRDVNNTKHDMFCPGMSLDFEGRAVITGGDDASKTTIYDPGSDSWTAAAQMNIGRGYQASATLSDGRIFTIGGSWSDSRGGKFGEAYDPASNTWKPLPGCAVGPMLTADAQGIFRQDNHAWLFGWKNGSVFQAGPSKAMNWYKTSGNGSQTAAGVRTTTSDAMTGSAVMYDAGAGKIFTAGGSKWYQNCNATNEAHLITINNPDALATIEALPSMTYERAFANSVVLPDGTIFTTGGQVSAMPFTDTTAILIPELWSPVTRGFTQLPPHAIPRTYHSIALLMLDGRVFTGGGGLCGTCTTNHEDAQIYSPGYLFNSDDTLAQRPNITSPAPRPVPVGTNINITTNVPVVSFALIRYGSTTHTVDTDQRRIPLIPLQSGTTSYVLAVPGDAGVALPGYWMLFAIDAAGVPSVAQTIKIVLPLT